MYFISYIINNQSHDISIYFSCSNSNGKEKDYESGFHYYGARYYWCEVLTGWLSVDPLADKYPSISPYAYCAWNPVKLVDPDGMEAIDDWYKNEETGAVFWHEGHAQQLKYGEDTYHNIGESYSKPIGDGKYINYFQNCPLTLGSEFDVTDMAYHDKSIRTKLISRGSPLPDSHKIDLFANNVASRGRSTADMVGLQLSANLIIGGGLSVDVGMGFIKGDGMYGSLSLSPASGFDFSVSAGFCSGRYHGSDAPSKANYSGLSYNVSAGAGSFFYQHSTSDLRGNGWNVSTFGASIGSEIFFGGAAGISHSWVW